MCQDRAGAYGEMKAKLCQHDRTWRRENEDEPWCRAWAFIVAAHYRLAGLSSERTEGPTLTGYEYILWTGEASLSLELTFS